MPDCWVASAINYAFGIFVAWWIWGRKLRDLHRAVEKAVQMIDGEASA